MKRVLRLLKKVAAVFITVVPIAGLITFSDTALAADAVVIFGSDEYTHASGEEFPLGVYIDGDNVIGDYHVEIEYDTSRMRYERGASYVDDAGRLILEGTGDDSRVGYMIYFTAVSGGETRIRISGATVSESGNRSDFDITELANVPIHLEGEDIAKQQGNEVVISEEEATTTAQATEINEEESTPAENDGSNAISNALNNDGTRKQTIGLIALIISMIAAIGAIVAILIARAVRRNKRLKNMQARAKMIKRPAVKEKNANKALIAEDKKKPIKEYKSAVIETPEKEKKINDKKINVKKEENPQLIKSDKKQVDKEKNKEKKDTSNIVKKDIKENTNKITEKKNTSKTKEKPVIIDVDDVSMVFKVANANTSGLKDYVIQKAKGNIKRRELKALDHVSFQVHKGEVIGIIGTNGSGKSTLLKIISGALNPTGGRVVADHSKMQLLTLGTGFDGELSARENVYLNGAIIGYSKEFIDEHFDEIVEFAELDGFMDEKVKNFSSGMVSRLAFSIATVGKAAEILILDEVLSVGDEFFRRKSMQRVQEMIHGGSTVLIVSHGMWTIRTHCDRVVWIEKGVLQMVGSPKEVCDAYSKSHVEELPAKDKLNECSDINIYLNALKKFSNDELIIMSYYPHANASVSEEIQSQLECLNLWGLTEVLRDMGSSCYVSVIDGGKVVYEKSNENGDVKFKDSVSDLSVLSKASYSKESGIGDAISEINGNDYSVNMRGLNIVVWDKKKNELLDSVCFDIYKDGTAYRNIKITEDYTGIIYDRKINNWRFIEKGKNNDKYIGISLNRSDGRWYFVNKGIFDESYTGLAVNATNGKWYYVEKGIFDPSYTGLALNHHNGKWYHVTNGAWDPKYTGVSKNSINGRFYYVDKGRWDESYSGKVVVNGKSYNIKNGRVI